LGYLTMLLPLAAATAYFIYRRDLCASRERLRGASRLVETACGAIEYAEMSGGDPVLIVHGAGGGFDQGWISVGCSRRAAFALPAARERRRIISFRNARSRSADPLPGMHQSMAPSSSP
jgi:hypothetical protein